jgi:hypothetical protein
MTFHGSFLLFVGTTVSTHVKIIWHEYCLKEDKIKTVFANANGPLHSYGIQTPNQNHFRYFLPVFTLIVQLKASGSHSFSFAGLILHRHQRKSYSTLSIDMSSKAGGDDTWQSQTGRNSSAKGSKRMGMAYCISF